VIADATTLAGNLTLGHVLDVAGLVLSDVVVLRHTYTDSGLRSPEDLTPAKVLDYTRWQGIGNKLGPNPPRIWLVFMADGKRRSRLLTSYDNHGELPAQRTGDLRLFDLRPSQTLSALVGRLVVEWSKDAVNWAKSGEHATAFPVVEIADPGRVPFPGFDRVLLAYAELQSMVTDSRYSDWRTALGAVQGVYLIADTSTGKLYVGKADGQERILGRWSAYAMDGHGGNVALRGLADLDPAHAKQFRFSLLRVFGPSVPTAEVDEAESHFKQALLTRQHGLNRN
jgi:hypothetical protein